MELDPGRIGIGERFDLGMVGAMPGARPVAPVGTEAMLHGLCLQYFKPAMVFQGLAAGLAEAVEIRA
ncbi:hypothetical protein D3C75_1344430 [compost metagenome]